MGRPATEEYSQHPPPSPPRPQRGATRQRWRWGPAVTERGATGVQSVHEPDAIAGRAGTAGARGIPQAPVVDLGYDLTGVEVEWQAADGDIVWSGWLPHPNLDVARSFTA